MGWPVERGMEVDGRQAVIYWTNEDDVCKVVFVIPSNEDSQTFLLLRKGKWNGDDIYSIKKNEETECSIDDAKIYWKVLVEEHDFEWYNHEHK
jgi:hypothetical protein